MLGSWVLGSWVLGSWVLGSWVLGSWVLGSWVLGVRMNIDDSRLIVRFQGLITEMLVEKRL